MSGMEIPDLDPAPDLPLVYDASNPDQVKEKKRKAHRLEADDAQIIKDLMTSRLGRAFLYRLMSYCNIFSSSLGDHHYMAFNEGRRDVGLYLFDRIGKHTPEAYMTMMKEHADGHY